MTVTTEAPATLHHKTMAGYGVKVLDEEQGIVEAFVSGIGNKDSVGDIIEPGAFVESLKRRTPKGVWSHDWSVPVSKTLEIREVAAGDASLPMKMKVAGIGGLYVKMQFNLGTQRGRDAYSDVKFFGDESEWSIGYMTEDAEYDSDLDATRLKAIELYEYSPVLFGANTLTSTVSVKVGLTDGDETKTFEVKVEGVADATMEDRIVMAVKDVIANVEKVTSSEEETKSEGTSVEEVAENAPDASELEADEETGVTKEADVKMTLEEARSAKEKLLAELATLEPILAEESKTAEVELEKKSIAGSFEERQEDLQNELNSSVPDGSYAWVIATFDSSVVYAVYGMDPDGDGDGEYETVYYQASYGLDDDGDYSLGTPTEVDVVQVVVTKAHEAMVAAAKEKKIDLAEKEIKISGKGWSLSDDGTVEFEDVEEKAGRMLSAKNYNKLKSAHGHLTDILDSAGGKSVEEEELETKTVEEKTEVTEDEGVKDATQVNENEDEQTEDTEVKSEEQDAEVETEDETEEKVEKVSVSLKDLMEFEALTADLLSQ